MSDGATAGLPPGGASLHEGPATHRHQGHHEPRAETGGVPQTSGDKKVVAFGFY